jgi:tellurite resistance protein
VIQPSLAHLPLPLLSIPMGVGGAGLAWREAARSLGAPAAVGEALLALTALAWIAVVAAQALRAVAHGPALLAELRHPVRAPFAAAPTIGLMIISGALLPYAPGAAALLWAVTVPLHLLVAMLLLRRMLAGQAEVGMLAPPLLIPFVGNILAPVFGMRLGFVDASWAMFGIGLTLWLLVMPLLLYRMVAGPALPPGVRPALAIFVAPPAVGALALAALTGATSGPVLALAGLALLIAAALLSMVREIAATPFGPAWWGLTFPSAAFVILLMVLGAPAALGWTALAATTGLTLFVALRTVQGLRSGALLRPEH